MVLWELNPSSGILQVPWMLNRVPLSPYDTTGVQPVSHGTMGAQPSYLPVTVKANQGWLVTYLEKVFAIWG